LKLTYASARLKTLNRRGWELTIREARHQLRKLRAESPSLWKRSAELLADAYESGRNSAMIALKLPDSGLPEISPWSLEQIFDDGFLPKDGANSGRTAK
jgi:hypothetical protein